MEIKKIVFLLSVILFVGFANAQSTEIFKSESKVESPEFGNYNVNVLYLYGDGTYKILWQKYSNKKMARKNIILDLTEEYGSWSKTANFIELKPEEDTKKQKMKFKMKNENKLLFIMEDGNTGSTWCKVKR